MALLTAQSIKLAGLTPSFVAAAAGGDEFVPGMRTFLVVKNGGGASIDVTIDSVKLSNYGTDENVVVSVGAGAEKWIGPIDPYRFRQADGNADVTYSAVTSVTVAAVTVDEDGL